MTRGWKYEPERHALASKGVETTAKSKLEQFHKEDYDAPPKELYEGIDWRDPSDLDRIIKLFWWCNLHDTYEWFNFDDVFKNIRMNILYDKLGEHNRLPEDQQRDYLETKMNYEPDLFIHLISNTLQDRPKLNVENRKKLRKDMYKSLNEKWKNRLRQTGEEIIEIDELARQYGYDKWYAPDFIEIMIEELNLGNKLIDSFLDLDMYEDSTYDRINDVYVKIKNDDYKNKITLMDDIIDMCHHTGYIFDFWFDIPTLRQQFEDEYL